MKESAGKHLPMTTGRGQLYRRLCIVCVLAVSWQSWCGRSLAPQAWVRRGAFFVAPRKVPRRASEAELRDELSGLRAREIKKQLDSLGVSSAGAFEKAELLELLVKARLSTDSTDSAADSADASDDSIYGVIYKKRLLEDDGETDKLNTAILALAKDLCETDIEGREWCARKNNYVGGYTSYGTQRGRTLHTHNSVIKDLERHLAPHAAAFFKELSVQSDQSWSLKDSWVNVLGQGAEHEMHDHVDSLISGTYYVQTPDDCPGICFDDAAVSPDGEAEIPVMAGDVILFPGQVLHRVPPNFGEGDRVGISFNFKFDREY